MKKISPIKSIRSLTILTGKKKKKDYKKKEFEKNIDEQDAELHTEDNDEDLRNERELHRKWYKKNSEQLKVFVKSKYNKIKKSFFIDRKV